MEIREKIKILVRNEKQLLVQILECLKVIDESELFVRWGFASMFEYCTSELGYSEGAAQRRVLAVRLLKRIPEVKEKIRDGSLSLTVAAQAQNFFREEDKYRNQVNQPKLDLQTQKDVVFNLLNLSSRESERKLLSYTERPAEVREITKAISPELTLIQFTANEQLMKDLKKLKSLTSHTNYEGRYDLLFRRLADIALDKLDPERQLARKIAREKRANLGVH